MPILKLENLGKIGIMQDPILAADSLSSFEDSKDIPVEAWDTGYNVRFRNGVIENFLGYAQDFITPSVAPHYALAVNFSGSTYIYYANGTAIWRANGTTDTDVTRTSGAYTGGSNPLWNGGVLGGVPIMNHSAMTDYPQQWDSATSKMKDLDNWPANTYAKVIRPFKQFLIALNIIKSGTEYPYTIKTSHPADPGTVPTSWDETDATKDTIERPLSETPDILVDGLAMGDTFFIYKERTTWGMQYIGGQFVFRTWKIFDEFGALAQNCAVNIPNGQLVVTRDDVIVHNGSSWQSVITDRNKKYLFANIDPEYKEYVFASHDKKFNEVWICYPKLGNNSPYAYDALVWNYKDNTWTRRILCGIRHIMIGQIPAVLDNSFDTGSSGTIDSELGVFNLQQFQSVQEQMLISCPADTKFYINDSGQQDDGVNQEAYFERTGLGIVGRDREGNWKTDLTSVKQVNNIIPKIATDDPNLTFNVSIAEQMDQNDAVTWHTFAYNPTTQEQIDCTIATRFFGIAFEAVPGSTSNWRFHGYDLLFEIIGRY